MLWIQRWIIGSNGILITFQWGKKKEEKERKRRKRQRKGRGKNGNGWSTMGVLSTDQVRYYMICGYGRDLIYQVCPNAISIDYDLCHFIWMAIYPCVFVRCSSAPSIGCGLTLSKSVATHSTSERVPVLYICTFWRWILSQSYYWWISPPTKIKLIKSNEIQICIVRTYTICKAHICSDTE